MELVALMVSRAVPAGFEPREYVSVYCTAACEE